MAEQEPKVKLKVPRHSSAPPERASQTKFIPGEEVGSSRGLQLAGVPSLWLDRLLVASTELPVGDGEDAVIDAFMNALAGILPTYAVGACFVASGEDAGQRVIRHVPTTDDSRANFVDPTRLFPTLSHERVFDLVGAASGSTIHVGGDDLTLDDDRAPVVHLTRRAGSLLAAALERARTEEALREKTNQLRALEGHVIQADKLASFGQIAAGMVHELNNPLTSIVAYTDYLLRKLAGRGTAHVPHQTFGLVEAEDIERLRRISESANRMLRFTRDLVSYARPSSEAPVPVVVHTAIDQAIAFCEHVLHEAGARVVRVYGAEVLAIRGMPEQLAQVFVNLITNACHAMPAERGEVTITTELVGKSEPHGEGRRVRIVVADNGHGISGENLPLVFAPFFTTKGHGRGTGLGLSIVKSIVVAHGGDITAASDGTCGARFVIWLPLPRPLAHPETQAEEASEDATS